MHQGGRAPELSGEIKEPQESPDKQLVYTYEASHQVYSSSEYSPDFLAQYPDTDLATIAWEAGKAAKDIHTRQGAYDVLGGQGLRWALKNVDPEAGKRFQGHGIAKGDAVTTLNALLTKGVERGRTFYTTEFRINKEAGGAIGADHPFTNRGIIVLGESGKKVDENGIHYVVLGEEYNTVVNLLRKKYPHIEFIPWHEAPKRLAELASKETGGSYKSTMLTEENRPHYPDTRNIGGQVTEEKFSLEQRNEASTPQNLGSGDNVW